MKEKLKALCEGLKMNNVDALLNESPENLKKIGMMLVYEMIEMKKLPEKALTELIIEFEEHRKKGGDTIEINKAIKILNKKKEELYGTARKPEIAEKSKEDKAT